MVGTLISAIVVGAIVGGLARLILPGKQNISLVMTIALGALGAMIGAWLVGVLLKSYDNANGGIAWIPLFVSALVAAGLIVGYGALTGKREV